MHRGKSPIRWWHLLAGVLVLQAEASIIPPSTTLVQHQGTEVLPRVTQQPVHVAKLARQAITTSFPEPSVCGYFDGNRHSRLGCGHSWNCVFHSSNSAFPGMVGCCPTSSTELCSFHSTCYNSAKVSATPTLRTLSTDKFVQLCTDSSSAYCFTWVWPDLSIEDYRCSNDGSLTIATLRTVGSLTDETLTENMSLESISMSWIGDGPLQAIASLTETEATSGTIGNPRPTSDVSTQPDTGSSKPSSTSNVSPSPDPNSTKATPLGAIIGGVVGGVGGLTVIVAAIVLYRLRKKRKDRTNVREEHGLIERKRTLSTKPSRSSIFEQQLLGTAIQPAEMDATYIRPQVELDSTQRAEMDAIYLRPQVELDSTQTNKGGS
ncbi:hypothetical protein FQN57_007391 [Myotisia sp. PD_48]|nr:hypothetical protein FQN57_007391 [Myotisia sp. PD_48]